MGPKIFCCPLAYQRCQKSIIWITLVGWSVAGIFDLHCQGQFKRDELDRGHHAMHFNQLLSHDGRDNLMTKQDIRNLKWTIDKETWLYDDNDQASVGHWIREHPERVLYSSEFIAGPPGAPLVQQFALALQSKWQLDMIRLYAHGSVLALDSTFATNKHRVIPHPHSVHGWINYSLERIFICGRPS